MIVAVLGASGVIGRNLLPRLVEAGHRVRAGMRHRSAATDVDGVEQFETDILDRDAVSRLVTGADALVNLASSIPRADGTGGAWALYDRIRREGTENAIFACEKAKIPLIAQSIAMLHCSEQTREQDESSPLHATGPRVPALDAERILAASEGDYRVVRGGALYGPGTSVDDDWFARYERGELSAPGDGSDYLSPIHVADLAAAFHVVLERGSARRAYIACDDEPMRYSEVFEIVAALSGQQRGAPGLGADAVLPGFRVSNAALCALAWAPRYASVRSGLVATAEHFRAR
jgi:nucleoside-diphosphate-sugar epimerase